MNRNVEKLRTILEEVAELQPGESREEAVTRAAGIAGVSYRVAKAVIYGEERRYVTCDDARLARAVLGLARYLADEEVRREAALAHTRRRRDEVHAELEALQSRRSAA